MKIYGHPGSTCTRKVLMTLNETSTPFELELVDFAKGEHKQPAHMSRQPFGQMPALDDGDFHLYESRAMARYIDAKAGSPLTPSNPQERALMEQFISIETSNFAPHAMKFIYQTVFKREQPPEVLAAAGKALDTALDVLERRLSEQPFLAGKTFSIADIGYAPYLEYLSLTPAASKIAERAHVAAWWNATRARPAWQKTLGN